MITVRWTAIVRRTGLMARLRVCAISRDSRWPAGRGQVPCHRGQVFARLADIHARPADRWPLTRPRRKPRSALRGVTANARLD